MTEKICVVGLGYIGLPTASLLATKGFDVHGVDVNADVVETINEGRIHIVEPGLDILVRSAVHSGNLSADLQPVQADVFVIAVPTPFRDGHQPDLTYVMAATDTIAPYLRAGNIVILESTSPAGTTERIASRIAELRPELTGDERLFVAHCPERVLPGQILRELVENDRVVGGVDPASTERAVAFYEKFVSGQVLSTDARTAELCKLVENSYRDVNIAFANELSLVAHELQVDVWELIRLANRHPRVNILQPGPGVGGHCLAVDPWFIVSGAPEQATLIRTGREVNEKKTEWVVSHVQTRAARFRAPVIACLGLSYKPDIDDVRESPALDIAKALTQSVEGTVLCVDPHVEPVDGLTHAELDDALSRADIVVALVAHRAFKQLDRTKLHERVLIDTCGVFR